MSDEPIGIRNWLSPASLERLAILAEEMGEALQIVGKILRHGWHSEHPSVPGVSNVEWLERELGDVLAAIRLLSLSGDVRTKEIFAHEAEKLRKFKLGSAYLKHQPSELLAAIDIGNCARTAKAAEYIPTAEFSMVEKLIRQPAGLPEAGMVIAEVHRFYWKTGSRAIELDSRRLKISFAGVIGGQWMETWYERKESGKPFERVL